MSEIYNWLKRSEAELVNSASAVVLGPNALESVSKLGGWPENPVDSPKLMPMRQEAPEYDQFEISSGDPLISYMLDCDTFAGEQYRLLRTKLLLQRKERALQKILITSAAPNEGKTITSCSLAGILAQEPGKRVVLVDADLRRPKAAVTLGCPHPEDLVGLSDVLRGDIAPEEALLKSAGMELFLLPSGGKPKNPAELLSSPNLEHAFRSLAGSFDWVVIDSPPILALADTLLLAATADFTLLVIRLGYAPTMLIQEAVQRVGREKIGGIAMNRVKRSHHSRYYRSYYSGHGDATPKI